jgi:hypothetical protein
MGRAPDLVLRSILISRVEANRLRRAQACAKAPATPSERNTHFTWRLLTDLEKANVFLGSFSANWARAEFRQISGKRHIRRPFASRAALTPLGIRYGRQLAVRLSAGVKGVAVMEASERRRANRSR